MLRKFLVGFLLFSLPLAATTLTILTFNDVYEVEPKEGWGGLAEMKTLLDREREQSEFSLTTVNGDFLSPSLLSSVTRGAHMVELFSMLNVDMVVHGNHEFDFGSEVLEQRMRERGFLWFGTNVLDTNGMPFGGADETWFVDVDDIRVGFFGLCTPDTAEISNPGPGITFLPCIETAQAAVTLLQEQGADVIIALTHQKIFEDMDLAKKVPEIDLILGGHEHQAITHRRNTLIHKSGYDAQFLGRIDLEIEKEGGVVSVIPSWRMIPNYQTDPDPIVKKRIDEYRALLDGQLSKVIGTTTAELDNRKLVRYSSETNMGTLIADAFRQEMGADCALINSAFIAGDQIIPVGAPITKGMVLKLLPYPNMVMVIEVTGEQLLTAVSYGRANPGRAYPQVSGLEIINCVFHINGKPLNPNATYTLAITDYLYRGGDGYQMLTHLPIIRHPSADNMADLLFTRYLSEIHENSVVGTEFS